MNNTKKSLLGVAIFGLALVSYWHFKTEEKVSPIINIAEIPSAEAAVINKPVLKPSDIKFLGYYRFAPYDYLWESYGGFALRKLNGQTHVFGMGDINTGNNLYEYVLPTAPPSLDINSAPIAALYKNWGSVMLGRTPTGGCESCFIPGGLYWEQSRNAIWWSYGDNYAPVQHHPTIGATILNDSAGTSQSYGPWRTEWNAQRTRDHFVPIPQSFADAYLGGKNMGIMAGQHSGNYNSPFGASLSAMTLPDPIVTPPDTTTNPHWTILATKV